MITIGATTPLTGPPAWAVLERQLFDLMDQSVQFHSWSGIPIRMAA